MSLKLLALEKLSALTVLLIPTFVKYLIISGIRQIIDSDKTDAGSAKYQEI